MNPTAVKRRFTTDEAAPEIGVTAGTLRTWRHQRRGPAYIKVGSKCFYELADLDEFRARHRVDPEQDRAAMDR